MKNKDEQFELVCNNNAFWAGYQKGKKDTAKKMLDFVDKECKFIAGVESDLMLDRLVNFIKKL